MIVETGNLDELNEKNPERKGWIVGSFIPELSMLHSNNCEVKWVRHLKGTKKPGAIGLDPSVHTLVVHVSGKCRLYFPHDNQNIVLSSSGDYIAYEAAEHEFEALEDTHIVVIRWPAPPANNASTHLT